MTPDSDWRETLGGTIPDAVVRTWMATPHFKRRDNGRPSYQLRRVDPNSFNNRRERRAYQKAVRRNGGAR